VHYVHRALAKVLELPMNRIRVIGAAHGGGFGGKTDPFAHEIIVAKLAMLTGRPSRPPPPLRDATTTLARHGRLLCGHYGVGKGIRDLRKHVAWYLKGYPAGGEVRRRLGTVSSLDELDELVDDVYRGNPRFASLMTSPTVPAKDKDRILVEAFEGRALPVVVRFLRVMNQHGRLGLL
ncbi:MAG: F0F1 ATP synthase subunit delta, partial [Thermoplasmatota archaeon]